MNTANAIGFFLLGTVMQVAALTASPSAGSSIGLADTQTLWLQLMGLVTGAIGAGYLLRMGAQEMSVMLNRLVLRRSEAREQITQGARARQAMPVGVRVRF
ncbi:hypothetical protein CMV30_10520 [Nibricoccus aquaticus]|uniref:Uncharacterized protein n=1 Tax=Nibricoccus aquaticus TaxID=2576891 RepID=A0A290QKG3_9BACT|nr:hypothetical protein [Nibricoccus aquaticus]ATC64352.1 hypothetical protein CMV30_10520 [Nibricoccus aquaticus]